MSAGWFYPFWLQINEAIERQDEARLVFIGEIYADRVLSCHKPQLLYLSSNTMAFFSQLDEMTDTYQMRQGFHVFIDWCDMYEILRRRLHNGVWTRQ